MCECTDMSVDIKTPRNVYLSAFYKRSFAFYTVKNRMPVILTQLIDNLVRTKEEIVKEFGEGSSEDLKKAIGDLSKLKYEIMTNKPLELLTDNAPDVQQYNDYINKQATEEGHTTHFNTIWLLAECYMYRKIKSIFLLTNTLKDFDYFRKQKEEAYTKSLPLIEQLGKYLLLDIECDNSKSTKEVFISLLKLNLWSNKCDLSISLGKIDQPQKLFDTHEFEPFVLADHCAEIWDSISSHNSSDIVDIVFDNSGYEQYTDFCLADFIITKNLAKTVRFYVKAIPWFISDVMVHEVDWQLEQLSKDGDPNLQTLSKKWRRLFENGTFQVVVDDFWTSPFDYSMMKIKAPELYKKLSEAKLIFFKGDLNYRKLFGEFNWDPVTSVETALQGFHPAPLCTLRTIKAHIVVGIKPGIAEKLDNEEPKWMEKGDYGLIQFCGKVVKYD